MVVTDQESKQLLDGTGQDVFATMSAKTSLPEKPYPLSLDLQKAIKMGVSAERLNGSFFPLETLHSIKGKRTYTFPQGSEEGGLIMGSRDGEYCLFRIVLEWTKGGPALREYIQAVQIVCLTTGDRMELNSVVTESSKIRTALVALVEPTTLKTLSNRAQASAVKTDSMSGFRFGLDVVVAVPTLISGHPQQQSIAGSISWRLVHRFALMLWPYVRGVASEILLRLPQSVRSGFLHKPS